MEYKIGDVCKFNYESNSKDKVFKDAVTIKLTNDYKYTLVESFNKGRDDKEQVFADRVGSMQPYFEAIDVRDALVNARKAEKIRKKSDDEIEAENVVATLKAELFPKKVATEGYVHVPTATDFFFRAYSTDKMVENTNGEKTALLASKAVTVNGKITFRYLSFNEVEVERASLDKLSDEEKSHLEIS